MDDLIKRFERLENLVLSTQKNILTIDELCILTGLSKSHIYKLTMRQSIPHYKQAKHLYFERSEIEKWLKQNPVRTIEQIENDASDYLILKDAK